MNQIKINTDALEVEFLSLENIPNVDSSSQVETWPTPVSENGRSVRIGVDGDGLRHLLIPVNQQIRLPVLHLETVTWSSRGFEVDGAYELFADIISHDKSLDLVFSNLCSEIIRDIGASKRSGIVVVRQVVREWKRLLKSLNSGLQRQEAMGLAGELEILEELAKIDPLAALETWSGSDRALHDFRGTYAAIEVKSWLSRTSQVHFIGDSAQLEDPVEQAVLYLASVELKSDSVADNLTDRADRLVGLGVPYANLRELLARRGFLYVIGQSDEWRFSTSNLDLWRVDSSFPRIQRDTLKTSVSARVTTIAYSLDLTGLGGQLGNEDTSEAYEEVLYGER